MRQLPLLSLAVVLCAQTDKLPSFDEYKVSEVYTDKPAEPRLSTAFARNFGTAIREGAARGPNFAGTFSIVQWGCGSGCTQMAVVNESNGAVYRGPFVTLDFSSMHVFPDGTKNFDTDRFEPLRFHVNSRLLVVRGCPEENQNNRATFYYEWGGSKFRLIQRFTAIPVVADPPAR